MDLIEFFYTKCLEGYKEAFAQIVPLSKGRYKVELWGASGGINEEYSGRGGYSEGILTVKEENETFYLYIGRSGSFSLFNAAGGCNGGGDAIRYDSNNNYIISGGGGSTELRNSKATILVAGGGGGSIYSSGYKGGNGGGEEGETANEDNKYGRGGTQLTGGIKGYFNTYEGGDGEKSKGGSGYNGGGGGGGYYGGGGSYASGGGGGSGYINKQYIKGKLYSGSDDFPSPFGSNENGHLGDGYAKISNINNNIGSCVLNVRNNNRLFLL